MKKKAWEKALLYGLILIAAAYSIALLKIILLKTGVSPELRQIQYIPFMFIKDMQNPLLGVDVVLKNILGNFALFIPLGILLPVFFRRLGFLKTLLTGFLVSLCFEVIQYLAALGMSDVDDLILNTLGTLVGAGLYFGLFFAEEAFSRRALPPLFFWQFSAAAACWRFGAISLTYCRRI